MTSDGVLRAVRRWLLAAALATIATLAGCATQGPPPTATGETRAASADTTAPTEALPPLRDAAAARAALRTALDALYAPSGPFTTLPNVQGYDSTFRARDPGGKSMSGTTSMRFGFDDTSVLRTTFGERTVTLTCGPEGYAVEGGDVVELKRRVPNVTCAGGGASVASGPPRDAAAYGPPLIEPGMAVPHADVELRFGFEGGAALVLTLDANDLLLALDVGTMGNGAFYRIAYGAREAIVLPAADARAATKLALDEAFRPGELSWRVRGAEDRPLRSEIEARVASAAGTSEANFSLAANGEQELGRFKLEYHDADADGRVTPGDWLSITSAFWIERSDFKVTLYDAWAGRNVARA